MVIVDPFARNSDIGTITNDLDPETKAMYHKDATDFLSDLGDNIADMVLYDPPYSARQVSESYKRLGESVNMQTTQSSYWARQKKEIARITKKGGVVITCAWNSGGIGAGLGFEQQEIRVNDGDELYVHLWSCDNWSIQTEQERFSQKYAEGLPKLCFSTLPSTGTLICINRGESGYYPSDWNTPDRAQNRQIADEQNQRLGVTPAQEEAMVCGSMHGWTVPGADPAFVEEMQKKQEQTGGMTLAQSM